MRLRSHNLRRKKESKSGLPTEEEARASAPGWTEWPPLASGGNENWQEGDMGNKQKPNGLTTKGRF